MADEEPIVYTQDGILMNDKMGDLGWFDWSYNGVDFGLAGNGGEECRNFLSVRQRIIESIVTSVFSGIVMVIALCRITLPNITVHSNRDCCGKRILLVIMCLTFGIELGFKLATRQLIYLLNPCHLATMLQIFCLAAPPSRLVTTVFRIHLHMLSGAPIAIIFPVINTRLLPFEIEVYYIQHILMLVIPVYLILKGGVYTPEPISDMSWAALSVGNMYIYHFVTLQYLAYQSRVNLNNMLCPAISDPFYGPHYRVCALVHQTMALPLLAKLMYWVCKKLSPHTVYYLKETKVIDLLHSYFKGNGGVNSEVDQNHRNVLSTDKNTHQEKTFEETTSQNGTAKKHTRQSSNGHIKSS